MLDVPNDPVQDFRRLNVGLVIHGIALDRGL